MTVDLPETLRSFLTSVEEYHQKTPHLAAFDALFKSKDYDRVLSSQAAEMWQAVLRDAPDDPLALHHTAIIRHGSGYRLHLEGGASAKQAIAHWKEGVQAWAKLLKNDAFWEGLRKKWEERFQQQGDQVAERLLKVNLKDFHRQLPKYLLSMHGSLAGDLATSDPELAAGHVSVILESGFSAEEVDLARTQTYSSLVRDVRAMCVALRGKEALDQVRTYLRIDPNYAIALASGLYVCQADAKRLQGDPANDVVVVQMFEAAKAWADNPALRTPGKSDTTLAVARSDFYTAWAECHLQQFFRAANAEQINPALSRIEQAFDKIQEAFRCERRATREKGLLNGICRGGAFFDINNGGKSRGFLVANRLLAAGLEREPNDPYLHAVRSYQHHVNQDRLDASRELEIAERLNRQSPDEQAEGIISQLRNIVN